jgi:uncharacterized protein YeaO (DUF488 family)
MPKVRIKRVYDSSGREPGQRILVDRIWPRGIRKVELADVIWMRDLAPSTALRKWFGHRPERWTDFRKRYWGELARAKEQMKELRALMRKRRVTLLYSAHDTEHNQAVALKEYLERSR